MAAKNTDSKSKRQWNEMATKDMDLWCVTFNIEYETEKYIETKMTLDYVWTFTITQNKGLYKGLTGKGSNKNRTQAEFIAYDDLMNKILVKKNDVDHLTANIRKQLIIGNVEQNPGPVFIKDDLIDIQLPVNKMLEPEDQCLVTLANDFSFFIEFKNFIRRDQGVEFQNLPKHIEAEINGQIVKLPREEPSTHSFKVSMSQKHPKLRRNTVYSNHVDYRPSLRLQIRFNLDFLKTINTNDPFSYFESNSTEGYFVRKDNFLFLPKFLISFWFSKNKFSGSDINPELYHRFKSSISNQDMDMGQLVETCYLLSLIQMIYLNTYDSYEHRLGLFYEIFESNVISISTDRRVDFSLQDCWNQLFKINVLIPYSTPKIKLQTLFKTEQFLERLNPGKLILSREVLKQISEKTLSELKIPENDFSLLHDYKSGFLNVLNPSIKPLKIRNLYSNFLTMDNIQPTNLNDMEKIVQFLIKDRFKEPDIYKSLNRTVDFAYLHCNKSFRSFILKLLKFRLDNFYQPNLMQNFSKLECHSTDFVETSFIYAKDKLKYINQNLEFSKKFSNMAQQEFCTWMNLLGSPSRLKVFYNMDFVLSGLQTKINKKIDVVQCGSIDEECDKIKSKYTKSLTESYDLMEFDRIEDEIREEFDQMFEDNNIENISSDDLYNQYFSKFIADMDTIVRRKINARKIEDNQTSSDEEEGDLLKNPNGIFKIARTYDSIEENTKESRKDIQEMIEEAKERRETLSQDSILGPEDLTTFQKFKNTAYNFVGVIGKPLTLAKEFVSDLSDGVKNFNLTTNNINAMYKKVHDTFDKAGLGHVSKVMYDAYLGEGSTGFSNFQSSLSTLKLFANAWFKEFIQKIQNLLGIDIPITLEISTLLFYYMVWIKTDDKSVKLIIILDILTQLGILDYVFDLIKRTFKFLKSKIVKAGFEDGLALLIEQTTELKNTNMNKLVDEVSKKPETTPEDDKIETENIFMSFFSKLTQASPKFLGAVAVAMIAALGYQTAGLNSDSIGKQVVLGFRNISFITAGVLAIPKLFEVLVSLMNFVMDYVKKIFNKDHKTELDWQKQIVSWMENTVYSPAISPKVLVRSIDACMEFTKYFGEMQVLKKHISKIKNHNLAIQFKDRCNVMENLYPTVASAIRIMIGQREVFHVQLYSEECGIGKTDANLNLIKILSKVLQDEENDIRETLGYKPDTSNSIVPGDIYSINETLKHSDMYYGQALGYMDEEGVFKNLDNDTVTNRMQMLSGFPCISQQASLNDKGRVFEFKVLVSNTNNPYNVIDGMLKPKALWRRRNLFEVKVDPKYLENGKISDAKIIDAGINRTNGEHLLFSMLNPTANDVASSQGDPNFANMTVQQFRKLVVLLFKKHIQVEEKRLFDRDSKTSLLRLEYDQLKRDIEYCFGTPKITEFNVNLIRQYLDEKCKSGDKSNNMNGLKEYFLRKLADVEKVKVHDNPEEDIAVDKLTKTLKEPQKAGLKNLKIQYQLAHKSNSYWYLVSSDKDMTIVKGDVDFSRFDWDAQLNTPYFKYAELDLSSLDSMHYAYWLSKFYRCFNRADFEREIKIAQLKRDCSSRCSVWLMEFKNIHNRTRRLVGSIFSWINEHVVQRIGKKLISALCSLAAIVGLFYAVKVLTSFITPNCTNCSYSEKYRTKNILPNPMQAGFADCYSSDIDLLKKATYKCYVQNENVLTRGIMIGIVGNCFLINKHVLGDYNNRIKIFVYDPIYNELDMDKPVKEYELEKKNISYIPNCDAAVISINGFRSVKTVLHHFVTEEDLGHNASNFAFGSYCAVSLRDPGPIEPYVIPKGKRNWFTTGFCHGVPSKQPTLKHDRIISFATTESVIKGDSGSLVVHDNPKISRKFIGIVLGFDNCSNDNYLGIVTQDQIKLALKSLEPKFKIESNVFDGVELATHSELYSVFKIKQELYQSPYPGQGISKTSGFKKSPIFETFPVETEPAIQQANDERIPEGARHFLEVSLNKSIGVKEPTFSIEEEKFMKNCLKKIFYSIDGLSTSRLFDTNEAIMGVRMKGSKSIDVSTSAGLPYKLQKNVQGKKPFISFNEKEKCWHIQPVVHFDVKCYESVYDNLQVPVNLKLEFRKKELVGPNKILQPKTRTVGTGNMIHQIVYMKIFKDFYTKVKNVWDYGGATPFALGIDPERHWDQLASHLQFLDCVLDYDVKAWEEKICQRLMYMSADVKIDLLRKFYSIRGEKPPDIDKKVYGMIVDYMDTYVVFEDVLYRKRSGLLSGHPGTLMENSEIHVMIICLICKRILEEIKPEWAVIEFILAHVKFIVAADDVCLAISKIARSIITAERIKEQYLKLGFEITAADKSDNISTKSIFDVQFLKHTFGFYNGEFYARPNDSIIYQLFNWIRSDTKLSDMEQFYTNLENAFRFSFWLGPTRYEEIREKANLQLAKLNFEWSYDYEQMGRYIKMKIKQEQFLHLEHSTEISDY